MRPRSKNAKLVGTALVALAVVAIVLIAVAIARGSGFVGSSLLVLAGVAAAALAGVGWVIRFLAARGERNRTPPTEPKLR